MTARAHEGVLDPDLGAATVAGFDGVLDVVGMLIGPISKHTYINTCSRAWQNASRISYHATHCTLAEPCPLLW